MTNTHHDFIFLGWCSVWAWRKPGIKSWLRPEATISKNPKKPPKPPKKTPQNLPKITKKGQKHPKMVKKCLIQFLTRPPLKRLRNFWGGFNFYPPDLQNRPKTPRKPSKNDPQNLQKLKKPQKRSKNTKKVVIQFLTRPPLKRLRNFWGGFNFYPPDLQNLPKVSKKVKKDPR